MREPRALHCMVQIDDCKIAIIGGVVDGSEEPFPNNFIDVYDTEKGSWEVGPA